MQFRNFNSHLSWCSRSTSLKICPKTPLTNKNPKKSKNWNFFDDVIIFKPKTKLWRHQKNSNFLMTSSFLSQKRNFAKKCWRHQNFPIFLNFQLYLINMQLWWKFELDWIKTQGDIAIFRLVTSLILLIFNILNNLCILMTS